MKVVYANWSFSARVFLSQRQLDVGDLWLACVTFRLDYWWIESITTRRFWARDDHRKWLVFLFNLSSHYHIYIANYLSSSTDNKFENEGETTVMRNVHFRFPSVAQKRRLQSLQMYGNLSILQ